MGKHLDYLILASTQIDLRAHDPSEALVIGFDIKAEFFCLRHECGPDVSRHMPELHNYNL